MNRPNGILKKSNEYAQLIPQYDRIPKAVFAAIAASLANIVYCQDDLAKVNDAIFQEWSALYDAGIVPQKPIAKEAI